MPACEGDVAVLFSLRSNTGIEEQNIGEFEVAVLFSSWSNNNDTIDVSERKSLLSSFHRGLTQVPKNNI